MSSLLYRWTSGGRERRGDVARACENARKSHRLAEKHTRRDTLLGLGMTLPLLGDVSASYAATVDPSIGTRAPPSPTATRYGAPDYSSQGPLQVLRLPRLKHIYTSCSTSADRCTLKISAWVPQGGSNIHLKAPFPLAVVTPGFLIGADQYNSYAERLASWGYVVVSYDFSQQVLDPTSDIACVKMLEELIDWCSTSGNPLGKVCDPENIMLIGHSRGGKISTLAAINDKRVKSLFLLDPVDVTVYTPDDRSLYPSATTALSASRQLLPVCIVGAGKGGDCAPVESSYDLFYRAARGPAWKAVVEDAGHLQFLDARATTAMGAFCQAGASTDDEIKDLARIIMVAWAESSMKRPEDQRIGLDLGTGQLVAVAAGAEGAPGRNSVEDAIDGVFDTIKRSPIPAMFEYKNMGYI